EDEVIIARNLETRLVALGYTVVGCARTAAECLARAREQRPDLALMDIRLAGGSDGIEAAHALRLELDTAVVFTSAYSDDETIERASRAKAFGFLVKPFPDHELHAAIEIAIGHCRMERRERERLTLLADACLALPTSLDLEKTLDRVLAFVVP